MDDDVENLDPWIATHAQEFRVYIKQVLFEVHSKSYSKENEDSFQETLNTQTLIDSTNVGQSSRCTAASTSTSGYNGFEMELMMETIIMEEMIEETLGNNNTINI